MFGFSGLVCTLGFGYIIHNIRKKKNIMINDVSIAQLKTLLDSSDYKVYM